MQNSPDRDTPYRKVGIFKKVVLPLIMVLAVAAFAAYAYYMYSSNSQMPKNKISNSNVESVAPKQSELQERQQEQGMPQDSLHHKMQELQSMNIKNTAPTPYSRVQKIEIIAPSSAFFNKQGIEQMLNKIESEGFEHNMRADIYNSTHSAYSANSEQYRFEHLKESILNKEIGIIWPIRGGYGAQELAPYLMQMEKPEIAKMYIGYSDSTILLLFFNQFWGWQTVHGPMPKELVKPNLDSENFKILMQFMKGELETLHYKNVLKPANSVAQTHVSDEMGRMREIRGEVTGGNLSTIVSTMSTPWEIETNGKILIIEDTNEKMFQVERMLHHLRLAGKFNHIKALVLSGIEDPPNALPYHKELFDFTIKNLSKKFPKLPIYYTDVFGHGFSNYPFVIGSTGSIRGGDIEFLDLRFRSD